MSRGITRTAQSNSSTIDFTVYNETNIESWSITRLNN